MVNGSYRTRDTNLAAFLLASRSLSPSPYMDEDGVIWWCYDVDVRTLKRAYHRGATIPAVEYSKALRSLRGQIRRMKDGLEKS